MIRLKMRYARGERREFEMFRGLDTSNFTVSCWIYTFRAGTQERRYSNLQLNGIKFKIRLIFQ